MKIIFVRHSESENNILSEQLRHDRTLFEVKRLADAPLTARGVEQSLRVASRIANTYPEASLIITSYLHRALRTAQALHDAYRDAGRSPTVLVDSRFHEVGGHYTSMLTPNDGRLQHLGSPGRTSSDVAREFPMFSLHDRQQCDDGWWHHASKESAHEAATRALALWHTLLDHASAHPAGVVVVTHGHLYAVMMLEGAKHGLFRAGPKLGLSLCNTGVSEFDVHDTPERKACLSVVTENDVSHVEDLGALRDTHPVAAVVP